MEHIVTRDSRIKHIIAMSSLQVSADVGFSLSTLQHQLIYKSKATVAETFTTGHCLVDCL